LDDLPRPLGDAPRSRVVVIEFPDDQTALDCYQSPEYRKAKPLRDSVSTGDLVVEGYDGLQPGQRPQSRQPA
jgi:uncharacterized protein (DUF1330 family)